MSICLGRQPRAAAIVVPLSSTISSFLAASTLRHLLLVAAIGLWTSLCSFGQAQKQARHIQGQFDSDIFVPITTGAIGRVDAGAIEEITLHRRVVQPNSWSGMLGTGRIAYGNEDTTYTATLSIANDKAFRLDAQTARGPLIIKINGKSGIVQEGSDSPVTILPKTAASGFVQLATVRKEQFPDQTSSLIDHGAETVNGKLLHRITLEVPLNPRATVQKREIVATDMYFDPSSHLLVKSVNSIRIDGAGNNDFLRVITYEDYRQVGSTLLPFRYTQTLNGQKQWTIQLSDIQLNPTLDSSIFEF